MTKHTRSHSLKTLLLFDAETLHYRQSVYNYIQKEFRKHGYDLKVVYDKNLNDIQNGIFTGIDYTFANFNRIIKVNGCRVIILFVWLRYKFLLPFMLYNRLKGIKTITWSHGINLQRLAHALIIFSQNEKQYIKASHKKLFVANNTLNFHDFPTINASKNQLKEKYGFAEKYVVLCVGRMDTNNRKLNYLLQGFAAFSRKDFVLVIVGPGVSRDQEIRIKNTENIYYLGTVYDPVKINEIYKMSDIFCMPGAIGLAINQAFYHGLPVVIEDVPHGPEGIYLKEGENGFLFKKGDIEDMMKKIQTLCRNKNLYEQFSNHARKTIRQEGSVENMFIGFLEAIRYVER
jgi:glycosyltransferase involved in cell wall biosynthesis